MRVVDLFAGAGGSSTGATMAGLEVVWAANHWAVAVECHAANHRNTEHVCQDLHLFPSCEIPDHDILLASPSCKGHSPARGKDRPSHDKHRTTAWIVVDALEAKRPPFAVIENVPAMRNWVLYEAWTTAVQALGYSIAEHILDAADAGVPQNRERLFLVLSRSKHPLHLTLPKRAHRPIAGVIDWSAGRWGSVPLCLNGKPRALSRIRQIEQAVRDGLGPRFLIPYYSNGSGKTGRCLSRPVGTITTRDRWAAVDVEADKVRHLSTSELRQAMGFPDSYTLPQNKRDATMLLGNAVCPAQMRDILQAIQAQG